MVDSMTRLAVSVLLMLFFFVGMKVKLRKNSLSKRWLLILPVLSMIFFILFIISVVSPQTEPSAKKDTAVSNETVRYCEKPSIAIAFQQRKETGYPDCAIRNTDDTIIPYVMICPEEQK